MDRGGHWCDWSNPRIHFMILHFSPVWHITTNFQLSIISIASSSDGVVVTCNISINSFISDVYHMIEHHELGLSKIEIINTTFFSSGKEDCYTLLHMIMHI